MRKTLLFLALLMLVLSYGQNNKSVLDGARQLIDSRPEKAIQIAENVLHKANNDQTKIVALTIIINAEMFLEKSRDVIDHCNLAIKLARKGKYTYQEIKVLSMLGSHYQTMMLNESAKKYLDKAENMMDSIKLPDSLYYVKGNLYNVKGMVFREELNCEFALKYFDKALDVYQQQTGSRISIINQALINIQKGSCLISEGRLANAQECFEKVLDADFDFGFNRYYAKICLAEILLKQNKPKEAADLLAGIPVREIEKEDLELSSLYDLAMSNLSNAKNDMPAFHLHMEKYAASIKDVNKKRSRMISQLVYDSDVKFKKSLDNNQRAYLLIVVSVVICALILLFTVRKLLS